MDTRTKIVQSLNTPATKTIVGYFDPMHAGHVRRLQELCQNGERLAVIVADPPEPILPTRARAELLAALDCVTEVIAAGANAGSLLAGLPSVIDERTADVDRSRTFAQHVLARYNTR